MTKRDIIIGSLASAWSLALGYGAAMLIDERRKQVATVGNTQNPQNKQAKKAK